MTTEQLNSLVRETLLVEFIAQRVVEKLLARMKQALVVFTGSNISADQALEAMGRLRADGFTFRVLLSNSAASLLNVEAIRSVLEPEELWIGTPGDTPEALTARYDTIIVPAATVRTTAHVAACMADTPAAAVILDGLMRGKDVILATDGCCPDHSERARRGFRMAEPLKQTLRSHLETLQSYGARLTSAERLDEAVKKALRKRFTPGESSKKPSKAQAAPAGEIRLSGHVIGGQQMVTCPSNSTVWVESHALVTQLAADDARRRGITIRKDTESR